jgi:hypothetical protein
MKIRLLTLIKICVDTTEWVAQKAFGYSFSNSTPSSNIIRNEVKPLTSLFYERTCSASGNEPNRAQAGQAGLQLTNFN